MIRVSVEIWPRGDQRAAYPVAEAVIANSGEGTLDNGHYHASIGHVPDPALLADPAAMARAINVRSGEVHNFARLEDDVWKLIYLALKAIHESTTA